MTHNAAFYFANLCADVSRCAAAAERGDETRYHASLSRAWHTLAHLRTTHRPEAYEEGLLMLRGLALAREQISLQSFRHSIDALVGHFTSLTPRLT